jgi:outer membrane protein TolC
MKSLDAHGDRRWEPSVVMALLLALLPVAAVAQSAGEQRESAITDRVLDQYRDLLGQETLAFTIAQAVDVASELHPEVRLNRERLAEFPSLAREARSPYLPQLDLNLQFAQTRDPGFRNSPFFSRLIDDPGASPFGGGDEGGFGAGDFGGAFTFGTYLWNFQASQVLWSFGLRPALRGVEVGRERVEADLEEVQNRIARDTVIRLHSYLLGLRTRDVLRQAVETSERGLGIARDRLELGAGARLDVLRARVQLSRLRRQLADAEDALMVEQAGINALVGRDQTKAIEVLDALELPDPLPRVLPAEALMELAGQQRPTLRQFDIDRELLDVQTTIALADSRPEIRANASYGINTFTFDNTYDLALHNWNAGVSLNWSLFDGFGSGSRVASLRSQITQNDWEQNEYESTLEVTLRNATANWQAALTAIEEATLALEEAMEAERVAGEELEAGAATAYLVMETVQARREVELERAQHTHDALNALAELKYLVGFSANAPHSVIADTAPVRAADDADAGHAMPELEEER